MGVALTLASMAAVSGGETIIDLEPFPVVAPNISWQVAAVDQDRLETAKPVDLASVLSAAMPEAALSRRSPLAGDLLLRGLSRDNLQISVDQTKTFCACPNRMDPPAFHVSTQQIRSVQVRTGPFSVDNGGSIGGSIEVETFQPDARFQLRTSGYLGEFDYWAGGVQVSGPITDEFLKGSFGAYYQNGGVYKDGDGVPFTGFTGTNYLSGVGNGDAFSVTSLDLKVTAETPSGFHLSLNFGYQDASDVLYPGLRMDATEDTLHRASLQIKVPLKMELADELEATFSYSGVDHLMLDSLRTSSQTNPAFAARGYSMLTEADNAWLSARVLLRKTEKDQHVRYAMEFQHRGWDADNVLGMQPNSMIPDVAMDTFGIFGVYERRIGKFAMEMGGRADFTRSRARDSIAFLQSRRDSSTNARTDFLPSAYLMVGRPLSEIWQWFGGIGMASRSPDPQERYINLDRPMQKPDWLGNPDLDPARNVEIQTGFHLQGRVLRARATFFHTWLEDLIYLSKLPDGPIPATTYTNLRARLYGFSLDADWKIDDHLSLNAGLAWQEGRKSDPAGIASNRVLAEVPPLRGQLGTELILNDFVVRLDTQFQAALGRIDPDLNERTLNAWTTANLVVVWRASDRLQITMGIDNLTDATYAVANSFVRDPFAAGVIVNDPGRFAYARVSLDF